MNANTLKTMKSIDPLDKRVPLVQRLQSTADSLESSFPGCDTAVLLNEAAAAISAAEQAQPVAWQWLDTGHFRKRLPKDADPASWRPLFLHPARTVSDERLRELLPKAHSTVDGKLGVRCSFESAEARKGDPIYTADQMLAFARAAIEESRK